MNFNWKILNNEFCQNIANLRSTTDFEKTTASISHGVTLRGYNFWILICSSLLASIGLDTGSSAVIIGAMLISPLMSPILGVGFSLAILDNHLLLRSIRNLVIAVVVSLSASVLYFVLTPLGEPTTELISRTFPTLLDVMVALFGGIAGIIAISRQDKTNAIPGVAIATALMPPLCTAGFGIATTNFNYFLGAFYLFFINAVFISLATYLIIKYLHFPQKQFVSEKMQRRYSFWFTVISLAALIPSIYFLYTVYQKGVIEDELNESVVQPIEKKGNEILKWEIEDVGSEKWIKVYHSGNPLTDSFKDSIDYLLHKHKMAIYKLKPVRVNLSKQEVGQLSAEMTRRMFEELHLDELKQQGLANKNSDTLSYTQIFKEVEIAFPFVDTTYNGWIALPDTLGKVDTMPVLFYKCKRSISRKQLDQLYQFLLTRFSKDTLVLIKQ